MISFLTQALVSYCTISFSKASFSRLLGLFPGDSGSWVVNKITGEVYGHVVSVDLLHPFLSLHRGTLHHRRAIHPSQSLCSTPSMGNLEFWSLWLVLYWGWTSVETRNT